MVVARLLCWSLLLLRCCPAPCRVYKHQECLAAAQETAERAAAADAQANQAPPPDGASVDSDAPTVEELRSLAKKAQERAAMMEKVWFDTLQMVRGGCCCCCLLLLLLLLLLLMLMLLLMLLLT